MDAYLPNSYIAEESHKIQMYKRIAAIESFADKLDVEEELMDRFGDMPQETVNLIQIAYIRALAEKFGFSEIIHRGREVKMKMSSNHKLTPRTLMILLNENQKMLRYVGSNQPVMVLYGKDAEGSEALAGVAKVLERINELQKGKEEAN